MYADLLARAAWALVIAGLLAALYQVLNWAILARARNKRLGLESIKLGVPAILYFTTPTCVPCRAVQRPALGRLRERLGDSIQVIEIDASAQPGVADYWGVLSVPTTFIIDSKGRPRRVNHGVTSAEKLHMQLDEVEQTSRLQRHLQSAVKKVKRKWQTL